MAQLQTILGGETQAPPEIVNFLDHRLVSSSGVWSIATNNLQVNQDTSPGMTVKVHQGYASILNATGSTHFPVSLTLADASVSITQNNSGFSRIDSIVLYINVGTAPNPDATNIATLVSVPGTPSGSPTAPNNTAIQAQIGASNPYIILANVTVGPSVTQVLDANITDKRTLVGLNTTVIPQSLDGWISSTDTFVYVSANSFKIVGVDRTTTFTKGTRVKFTNNATTYYGVVTASVFSTDTTVTLAANNDYSIANLAITNPYYSYQVNPQGYPTWFNYTPTFTGFSASPTVGVAKFKVDGSSCTLIIHQSANGTSNATTFTITAPIASSYAGFQMFSAAAALDSGGQGTIAPYVLFTTATTNIECYKDMTAAAWTASGGKRITAIEGTYLI